MTSIRRIAILVSTVIALAASTGTALAGQFNENGKGSYVEVPPASGQTFVSSGQPAAPTIVHVTAGSGFSWGDAAIGAAAGVAIAILIVGGGLVVTQRRTAGHVRHA
jgi:hypothetical protein